MLRGMALGLKPFVGKADVVFNAPIARINLWDGSVRSGKTINSLVKWVRWLRSPACPPGTLMLVSKTERTAKQNIVDPLYDIFGPRFVQYSAGNHEVRIAGRRHIIVGASDVRAEGKIRGITLAGMYGDEVTLWPESFFAMALSRLSVPGAAFFGTTNPDAPGHWLMRKYLRHVQELGIAHHHFTLDDNPNLDPAYVASLKKEYRGLWHKRYIDGLWAVAEGAVYDGLGDHLLLPELDVGRIEWTYAGVEHGTTNPTVFTALSSLRPVYRASAAFTRSTGLATTSDPGQAAVDEYRLPELLQPRVLVAHNEWRHDAEGTGSSKTTKELSVDFAGWRESLPSWAERAYVKPEANALILQLWRDGQKGIHPADDDEPSGIQETSALIGVERLMFHEPTVGPGWEEMSSYAWDPKASERGEDKPLRQMDSFPDALRFAVRGSRMRWRDLLATASGA